MNHIIQNYIRRSRGPVAVIIFISSLAALLFIHSEIGKNNEKSGEIAAATHAEAEKRDELRLLDRSVATVKSDRILLDRHFAQSGNIVPFLNEIESTARAAGVKAEVSNVNTLNDNAVLTVHIQADGSFRQVYSFIALLENLPYIVEFTSSSLERGASGDSNTKLVGTQLWHANITLKLITFVK